VAGDDRGEQLGVADVAVHELVPARHRLEVGEVAGVGELVEHGHGVARGDPGARVVRADESGPAGDEDLHGAPGAGYGEPERPPSADISGNAAQGDVARCIRGISIRSGGTRPVTGPDVTS